MGSSKDGRIEVFRTARLTYEVHAAVLPEISGDGKPSAGLGEVHYEVTLADIIRLRS
jgi:hypothetical protein